MKKNILMIIISFVLLIICSCPVSFFDNMGYKKEKETKKSVSINASLLDPGTKRIVLNWQNEKDADYYEVFKDRNVNGSFTERIYSGGATGCTDISIDENKFYYYKLLSHSDVINYEMSDPSSGIYSSVANTIKNISFDAAISLSLNNETVYPFYNFSNTLPVKKTSLQYFKYESPIKNENLVLNVKHKGISETSNTDIYIKYFYGDKESAEYKLSPGKFTKIQINDTNEIKYFRIRTENISSKSYVEDTGEYSINLAEDIYEKKKIYVTTDQSSIIVSCRQINDPNPDLNAYRYEFYRSDNNGKFEYVGYSNSDKYIDNNVVSGIDYKYYAVIYYINNYEEYTDISDTVYIMSYGFNVTSLKGSELQYTDNIHVEWNAVIGVDSYKLYRYTSKTDKSPISKEVTGNSYDDKIDGDKIGKIFFYKVSSIVNGREYRQSEIWAYGICFYNKDFFESGAGNDNVLSIIDHNETDKFDNNNPPIIYSFTDGIGNNIRDNDWYKIKSDNGFTKVTINVPSVSGFDDKELSFKWYYKGKEYNDPENPGKKYINKTGETDFIFTGFESDDNEVYFEISIIVSGSINRIGTYSVTISDSL